MAEQLCLAWSNYETHMMNNFKHLLVNQSLVDVTLACDGMSLKAHRVVLSACSSFFLTLFLENPCSHPIVILKDVKYTDMKVLLHFIYSGKVNISQNQLLTLKQTADILRMKGVSAAVSELIQSERLSQPSVSRPDEPPSKRRKRRSRKSSLSDQSDSRTSESGSTDSDVEEVYSSNLPLEVCGNETVPPEERNLSSVPTIPLLEETLQNKISMQEDHSSVQSVLEQRRQFQTSDNTPTTKSISVPNNSSEIANQQPEYSPGNVADQELMLHVKKAVKTLQEKGILPTTEKNGQSSDANSADKESSTSIPDIEIINGDSDIEEILPDKVPRQKETVNLDDDELILTDVIPSSMDSSQQMNSAAFNNKHTDERSSEISKGKRCTENENNISVEKHTSESISQDQPPSKRRKRRRQRASKRRTRDVDSIVLQLDSDGEVISNEPSSSFSTASTVDLNMKPSQSQQQCPDIQIVDKANAPNGLEPKKVSEKTVTTDDLSLASAATLNMKKSCQTQQQHPDVQDVDKVFIQNENSDFESDNLLERNIITDAPSHLSIHPTTSSNLIQVPLSPRVNYEHSVQPNTLPETNLTNDVAGNLNIHPSTTFNFAEVPFSPEVNYEHPESPSGELVVRNLLQELVARASRDNDGVPNSN